MAEENYSDPNGPSNACSDAGPTANEAAAADQEAAKQAEIARLAAIDKPLEQDGYDEGIMSLFGGLGGGLLKGGIMGLGKALVTGPAKELAKAVGKSALGDLFGGGSGPANGGGGAEGGSAANTDGAGGGAG